MLTREHLESLGINGVELTEVEHVSRPAPVAGQALGARDAIALSLVGLLQQGIQAPLAAPASSLRERGATLAFLSENSDFVRIRTVSGRDSLEVKGSTEGVVQFADDPGTVYWDTAKQSQIILGLPNGFAELQRKADGISVYADAPSIDVQSLAALDAPLVDWANRVNDSWSAAQLRRLAAIGSRWSSVIGAGLLGRLFESPSAGEALESAKRVIRLDSLEPAVWPRLWAQALTKGQCQTVCDLGLSEVEAVHQVLDDILDAENDSAEWIFTWTDICHRRDDIACAMFVLNQARSDDARLRAALRDIDSRGKATSFAFSPRVALDDERLRRIRATDPMAWWGSPTDTGRFL